MHRSRPLGIHIGGTPLPKQAVLAIPYVLKLYPLVVRLSI